MAIRYDINEQDGIVYTNASGVLDDTELVEHKRRLMNDPNFKPGMRELSDVRAVERLAVTADGVRALALMDRANMPLMGEYKLAIVASADVVYGMARMYQTLTERNLQNLRIFRDMDEAKSWLAQSDGDEPVNAI